MIRIGVLCPSDVAFRRFMPALAKTDGFIFEGIAVSCSDEYYSSTALTDIEVHDIKNKETKKAKEFINNFGGKIYDGYKDILTSGNIDAIYIPLPPALHFKWANIALSNNLHVLLEKPATLSLNETKNLIELASSKSLTLFENYMFPFHDQIQCIKDIIADGQLGDVRLYRITFGFPKRAPDDFRYNKALGGGALYDAGGYTLNLASMLLGEDAKIICSQMNYTGDFDVDVYGSASLINPKGVTAQIAFGMDNSYRCDLEIWGSTGILTTGRIFTAPDGFSPEALIKTGNTETKVLLPPDDSFKKSILNFKKCIEDKQTRLIYYNKAKHQARLVDDFIIISGKQPV